MRVISLERGFDPREFSLVCFGGAGGMHAADLARSMAIPRVIVPEGAGILSALGMLLADVVRDYSLTVLRPTDDLADDALAGAFATLEARVNDDFAAEGFEKADVALERTVDMRYVGQGFEIATGADGDFVSAFHRAHEQRYGYADTKRATEVVNIRIRATGETVKPELSSPAPSASSDVRDAIVGEQSMVVDGAEQTVPLYDREKLHYPHDFQGPALVVEYSTTTVVPNDYACRLDAFGTLILERSDSV